MPVPEGHPQPPSHVDYICEAPRISQRVTGIGVDHSVLFADCRHERTSATPSAILSREGYLDVGYETVVFRGGPGFIDVVNADQDLPGLCPGSVLVVESSTDPAHRAPRVLSPSWVDADAQHGLTVDTLREIELWGLVLGRGALHGGGPGQHFELRSGFHVNEYVRLRDAFAGILDAERIADWLLPYLDERTVVLGDRPNLGVLVQAVSMICKRRFGWDVDADTLDPWPRRQRTSAQTLEELTQGGDRDVLIVLAADSDARHEGELRMLTPAKATTVCLVDITAPDATSTVSFKHHAIRRYQPDTSQRCEACRKRNGLVASRIDARNEDILTRARRRSVKVAQSHITDRTRLWSAVERTEALRIHAQVAYHDGVHRRERHRPIHVDMQRLLQDEDPWFRDACRRKLKSLERPDRVIVPAHEVTEALRNILSDIWKGIEPSTTVVPRGGLTPELRAELPRVGRILVVDDALVTGKTMQGIIDSIGGALAGSGRDHDVRAFVAFCCPSGADILDTIEESLARLTRDEGIEHLHHGKLAYLPAECAFCEEQRVLRLLKRRSGPHQALVAERLAQLGGPVDSTTLLFGGADPGSDGANIKITPRLTVSPATAYAAFASAAQETRAEMTLDDGEVHGYLDAAHAIANYPQAPMLAGVLRTFSEHEVNYEAGRALPVKGALANGRGLTARSLGEIGWAAVMDKLPSSFVKHVDTAMERRESDPVLALLRRLLAQRDAGHRTA